MRYLAGIVLTAAASAAVPSAQAAFFNNATGLAAPQQTITFESVAVAMNQPITTEYQAFGVRFDGAFANPNDFVYPNISGNRISNFQSNIGDSPLFAIHFTKALSAVAFALVSAPGTSTFRALLNGVQVDGGSAATDPTNAVNFYGFQGSAFDEVRVSVVSFDRAFIIDNLQTVSAVPEPASWALLVAGAALTGGLLRRRPVSATPKFMRRGSCLRRGQAAL